MACLAGFQLFDLMDSVDEEKQSLQKGSEDECSRRLDCAEMHIGIGMGLQTAVQEMVAARREMAAMHSVGNRNKESAYWRRPRKWKRNGAERWNWTSMQDIEDL